MYTQDDYDKDLSLINPTIHRVSTFLGKTKPISLCCIKGHIWNVKEARNPLRGVGCPKCKYEKMSEQYTYNNETFLKKLYEVNKYVEPLEEYKRNLDKIKCRCLLCGEEFYGVPRNLLQGRYHINCSHKNGGKLLAKTHEEFISEVSSDIIVLSKYTNSYEKILCRCKLCGFEWNVIAKNLVGKDTCGCPMCATSKGERKISDYLNKENVNYTPQKTYDNLYGTGGGLLSYDFYLEDLNLLIEYQGRQHDTPIDYFGGKEQLLKQQEHDRRKREYAKLHNIELLEIWYYDYDNIEQILRDKLDALQICNAS
jgi:hypothetical protein